jgi:hypothetical protein
MGLKGSKPKLSKEDLEFLKKNTNFTEEQIKEWYKGFVVRESESESDVGTHGLELSYALIRVFALGADGLFQCPAHTDDVLRCPRALRLQRSSDRRPRGQTAD